MPERRVYLDHNATSPARPEAVAAFLAALEVGNPSSIHREGRGARARVEGAREAVADLVGARPSEVVFTSGGTEANAMALRPGALRSQDGRVPTRLLIGATDHASVLSGHGFGADAVDLLPVDGEGRLDLGSLRDTLARHPHEPCLVSCQLANSETGVLQPIRDIAALVHNAGGMLHADAVQAAGRIPVAVGALGIDALSLSAHKLGGLSGAGALVVATGREGPALAWLRGGGQERGRRAGTENAPAIAAFGAAAAFAARALDGESGRLAALRDEAERDLLRLAPDATVFGRNAPRLPNTLAFAVRGLKAETALIALDLAGIAVSSGSACSSGKVAPSHVLAAMGVPPDLASGAIRVSLGWNSVADDLVRFMRAFESMLQRLYMSRMARAA